MHSFFFCAFLKGETNKMSNLQELIPNKTVIATGKTRLSGKEEPVLYQLFYGNVAIVGDKKTEFPDKLYRQKLDLFFSKPDGEDYKQPTEEELETAYRIAHNLNQKKVEEKPEPSHYSNYSAQYTPAVTNQPATVENTTEEEEKETYLPEKIKKKVKKKKTKPEPSEEIEEDDDETEYYETESTSVSTIVLAVLVGVLAVTTILFGSMTFGIVNNPFAKQDSTVAVAVLNKSVKAGEQIHASDLDKEYITEDEYNNAKGTTIINKDGTQETDKIILWSNKDKVENAYALSDISEGNQLMLSDFTGLKSTNNWVTLSVDNQEVKIAASLVEEGQTEVRNYLIVTSKDSNGSISSYAIENGSFTLKDKNLVDVKDSDGNSLLEKITQKED